VVVSSGIDDEFTIIIVSIIIIDKSNVRVRLQIIPLASLDASYPRLFLPSTTLFFFKHSAITVFSLYTNDPFNSPGQFQKDLARGIAKLIIAFYSLAGRNLSTCSTFSTLAASNVTLDGSLEHANNSSNNNNNITSFLLLPFTTTKRATIQPTYCYSSFSFSLLPLIIRLTQSCSIIPLKQGISLPSHHCSCPSKPLITHWFQKEKWQMKNEK
jgi:hypothetical protein